MTLDRTDRKTIETTKMIRLRVAGATTLALLACVHDPMPSGPGPYHPSDECSAPRLNWMVVSEGVDSKELSDLAVKFGAAAKASSTQLSAAASGSGNVELGVEFSKHLEDLQQASRKVEVSQAFFENATNYRSVVCNLERQIKDGLFKDNPQVLEKAQLQLIDMANWFTQTGFDVQKNGSPKLQVGVISARHGSARGWEANNTGRASRSGSVQNGSRTSVG